ncbi:hypothetical protein PFISCL1PPCAC_10280, partial [Pristionchus fissidentatus]
FLRSDELSDKWSQCEYPTFSGLLICYMLRVMVRFFEEMHEWRLVEDYKSCVDEMEDRVLSSFDLVYGKDERDTREVIDIDYRILIQGREN